MPSVPRILRANADPDPQFCDPAPVTVRLWWRHLGVARDFQAWALTEDGRPSTLIYWAPQDLEPRKDWVRTIDVRLDGEPWRGPDRPLGFDSPYRVDGGVEPRPPHPDFGLTPETGA
ncbi:hypothetical protein LWF15_30645 [Kineosporia rhizophila]|uniref:hypothetical protein n=1 Tax=Kineosporia TaxID=49184 RepID=UPI001E349BF2|nr:MULTISPECIES: hypothetical protein [Kineosporia]MCE0539863.1 hypothetical protein [Kineosporia rhizophila]GLY19754.1 hypothetical protein Kisp01_67680 [Kineosporia sp. NBRC 101677]